MKLICQTEEGKKVILVIEGLQITKIEEIKPNNVIPTLKDILVDVSFKTGISVECLMSSSRFRQIVDARCIYFRRAKEITKLSTASIGKEVNRDHATVIHGINKAEIVREVAELYERCFPKQKPIIQDLSPKIPVLQNLTNPVVTNHEVKDFEPVKRKINNSYGIQSYSGYVSRQTLISR